MNASLPPHQKFDHVIDLEGGMTASWGPIYAFLANKLKDLREYLDKIVAEEKIRPSKSSAGSPISFVPKPNRGLSVCVDYCGLNKVTMKNRYSLPLMSKLRDSVNGMKIFSKLDLKDRYYLNLVKEGDEWKTVFCTRYGLYEYTMMPCRLANAPATFQAIMNEVLVNSWSKGS